MNSDGDGGANEKGANVDQKKLGAKLVRQMASLETANEVKGYLIEELPSTASLSEEETIEIFASCISAGNYNLAVSLYCAMIRPDGGVLGSSSSSSLDLPEGFAWPKMSVSLTTSVIKTLCRNLETKTALRVLGIMRHRGLEMSEDIEFGYVVECPDGTGRPLTLMQPQERSKNVPDSVSKYEYEVFSGVVTKSESESLVASMSWWKHALGARLGKLAASAVHDITIEMPGGQQRTLRYGTLYSEAPCKVGDRVSVVCSPERTSRQDLRYQGPLAPSPPGSRPGEPLSITNHTIDKTTQLLRPPKIDESVIPAWAISAFIVVVGADAASSLVDPILPYLVAGAVMSTAMTAAIGTNVVLPALKQLPEKSLSVQQMKQKFLKDHVSLSQKITVLTEELSSDIRVLARLWQLMNKMGSVDAEGTYNSRMERVTRAKDIVEERLGRRLSMVDDYVKVLNMIEIEVEMETQIPAAEYQGGLFSYRAVHCFLGHVFFKGSEDIWKASLS